MLILNVLFTFCVLRALLSTDIVIDGRDILLRIDRFCLALDFIKDQHHHEHGGTNGENEPVCRLDAVIARFFAFVNSFLINRLFDGRKDSDTQCKTELESLIHD